MLSGCGAVIYHPIAPKSGTDLETQIAICKSRQAAPGGAGGACVIELDQNIEYKLPSDKIEMPNCLELQGNGAQVSGPDGTQVNLEVGANSDIRNLKAQNRGYNPSSNVTLHVNKGIVQIIGGVFENMKVGGNAEVSMKSGTLNVCDSLAIGNLTLEGTAKVTVKCNLQVISNGTPPIAVSAAMPCSITKTVLEGSTKKCTVVFDGVHFAQLQAQKKNQCSATIRNSVIKPPGVSISEPRPAGIYWDSLAPITSQGNYFCDVSNSEWVQTGFQRAKGVVYKGTSLLDLSTCFFDFQDKTAHNPNEDKTTLMSSSYFQMMTNCSSAFTSGWDVAKCGGNGNIGSRVETLEGPGPVNIVGAKPHVLSLCDY